MRALAILLCLLSAGAWGATWYVAPSGSGAGATDGSSIANRYNGFADITWGVGGVQAGDTLRVLNDYGTYYERLSIGGSGTAGILIAVTGYSGANDTADYAFIESTVDVAGDGCFSAATTYAASGYPWSLVSGEVYKKSCSAIAHALFEDGDYLTPILGYGSSEGTIAAALSRGQFAVLPGTPNVIYYRASDGAAPSTHALRMTDHRNDTLGGNILCSGRDYLSIQYFDIKGAFPLSVGTTGAAGLAFNDCENVSADYILSSYNLAGVSIDGGVNITLGRNVIADLNLAVGLTMEATPVAINGVRVAGTYSRSNNMPVYATSAQTVGYAYDGDCIGIGEGGGTFSNIVVDGAVAEYCGAPDNNTDQGGSGLYVGSASAMSAGVSIKRSVFRFNHGCGLHMGDEWTGGDIIGNVVHGNNRGQTTGTCLFTVWMDLRSTGGTWLGGSFSNNTVAENFGSRAISFDNSVVGNTLTFKNNLFAGNDIGFGASSKTGEVIIGAAANDNILESNNDIYVTSGTAFFRSSQYTCAQINGGTWAAVSANTGDGTVCVDPELNGGASPDTVAGFCLSPDSPLIGIGTYLGAWATGYAGHDLGNPPAIGARGLCRKRQPAAHRASATRQ